MNNEELFSALSKKRGSYFFSWLICKQLTSEDKLEGLSVLDLIKEYAEE